MGLGGKGNLLADIRKGKDLKKAPQEKKMLKQARRHLAIDLTSCH